MDTYEYIEQSKKYVMNTYNRYPVVFARGEGLRLWDNEGRQYLDFVGGLAVCNLGHCHPAIVSAITEQAKNLLHVSNLYHNQRQIELAAELVDNSFADRAFFCNSGAEANEGAIKLARRFAWEKWGGSRYKIITFDKSFHGRTIATITATAQAKFQTGFAPLLEGFTYVPYNDLGALKAAIDDKTAAVLIETLQAEGGVNVPEKGYIEGVRRICDEHELILIFDEVQTGFGRTGKLFGYQHYGIEPDIMTLAKGLGSGVAIGALLAKEQIASAFVPGTHASTFGGNPLACAAALATIKTFFAENILENCVNSGAYLEKKLRELHGKYKFIKDVRGKGLIWGMELEFAVAPIINKCLEEGVLIINAGEKVLRFLPPLIVKPEHIDQMVIVLDGVLSKI